MTPHVGTPPLDGPPNCWIRIRKLAALLAVATTAFTVVAARPAAAATITAATAVAVSPTAIDINWAAPPVAVERWVVTMSTRVDKVLVGRQTVCGECFSAAFDYLSPATSYGFLIVGLGGDAGDGVWASTAASTPRDPLCPSPATCVVVDSTAPLGPAMQAGLGLNQGTTGRTDQTKLAPLRLNYHRIAAWDQHSFDLAEATGGEIAVIVSSAWINWTRVTYGVVMDPWDDWTVYHWFVVYLVHWHKQNNLLPDYWEIQNEPDQAPWYTGATTPPEADLVLQQFQTAYDAIRGVLPAAKIVGPSVGSFDDAAQSVIGIRTFLQYAAQHGLRVDAVAWHELGGDCWGACDAGPRGIVQHVASLQNLVAQHPSLGQPEVHVNEYGDADIYRQPGAAVGYFAAMAAANVHRAASACWPATYDGVTYETCFANPGMADGLLQSDGTTPTATWFVWQTYATMTGARVQSNVARADMSAVATRTTTGSIQVLVGRHSAAATAANGSVKVRIKVPSKARSYRVTATSVTPEANTAKVTDLGIVSASQGVVDLGSFTISDGASLSFTLVPSIWSTTLDLDALTKRAWAHRLLPNWAW